VPVKVLACPRRTELSYAARRVVRRYRREEARRMAGSQDRRPGPARPAADETMSGPDRKPASATAPGLLVIMPLKDFSCVTCGSGGTFLVMEEHDALCLGCADLGHLVFLPAGNAALSRRARAHSTLAAVVVRFSRSRGRYERQGILVEEAALQLAEEQCLADADARLRRRDRDAAPAVRAGSGVPGQAGEPDQAAVPRLSPCQSRGDRPARRDQG
jgi:hypothetical protein